MCLNQDPDSILLGRPDCHHNYDSSDGCGGRVCVDRCVRDRHRPRRHDRGLLFGRLPGWISRRPCLLGAVFLADIRSECEHVNDLSGVGRCGQERVPKRHIRRSPGENANHLHVRLPLFLERWLEVGPNNCPNFQPPDSDQGSEIQTRVLRSPDRMFLKCGPCRRSAAASPGPTSSYPYSAVSGRSAALHPPSAAPPTPLRPTPTAPHRHHPSS